MGCSHSAVYRSTSQHAVFMQAGPKTEKQAAPTRSARPVQSHPIQVLDSEMVRQLQAQLRELAAQLEAVSAQLAMASQTAIDEQKKAQVWPCCHASPPWESSAICCECFSTMPV